MTLDKQLDSALKQFQQWGVDFIMTDFIDRDDQPAVNFHTRIAQACANAKIMIMFHGSYPPKGFNRTWPNCITKEAVLGSEYNAWSDKPTATHNTTIPFTRMLAGPGVLDSIAHTVIYIALQMVQALAWSRRALLSRMWSMRRPRFFWKPSMR